MITIRDIIGSTNWHTNTGNLMIGQNVRTIRQKRGLSQRQLANMIGVTQSTLSYFENDQRSWTQKRIDEIANALDVPPSTLWNDDNDDEFIMICLFVSRAVQNGWSIALIAPQEANKNE